MITDGTYVRSRPLRLTRARPPRSLALAPVAACGTAPAGRRLLYFIFSNATKGIQADCDSL